jgi:ATP-dependent helicase/nuclease subunit A
MTRARDTLVLTAFDKSKDAAQHWEQRDGVSEREIASANSFFAWLRLWLGTATANSDWHDDFRGENSLLRWVRHSETAELFTKPLPGPAEILSEELAGETCDATRLRERVLWKYGHLAATTEPAKTNVTVLRRRLADEDNEARQLFRPRRSTRIDDSLSAAEIGSAHHRFQQLVPLERTASSLDLRNEAAHLLNAGLLTERETAALDFNALLRFWQSPLGRRIVAGARLVHRELPFTARFSTNELHDLGLGRGDFTEEEFVIVQGVVDLALIDDHGITLLDFKTDRIEAGEVKQRAGEHSVQLRLYAAALQRIYGKEVTERWLHFLSPGETILV